MLFEPVDGAMEIPKNAQTTDVLFGDAITVASPSTPIVSGAGPSLRLEGTGAAKASLLEDGSRVPDPVGLLGTDAQSPVLTSSRPTPSSLFGLYLPRGDKEAALEYDDFLKGVEEFKALPLKDQRRLLKNEVFRVSFIVILL